MNLKEQKKHLIVRNGLRIIYLKGYNGTGVKEITDSAGIPKGSFYNYFKSKEDFIIEVMNYFTEKEVASMKIILEDQRLPPLARIKKLYAKKVDNFIKKDAYSLGCLLCNITLEMADVNLEIANAADRAFINEYKPLIQCLKEAQDAGDLDPEQDVIKISDLIRNSWLGALVIMKANKTHLPLKSFQEMLDAVILK